MSVSSTLTSSSARLVLTPEEDSVFPLNFALWNPMEDQIDEIYNNNNLPPLPMSIENRFRAYEDQTTVLIEQNRELQGNMQQIMGLLEQLTSQRRARNVQTAEAQPDVQPVVPPVVPAVAFQQTVAPIEETVQPPLQQQSVQADIVDLTFPVMAVQAAPVAAVVAPASVMPAVRPAAPVHPIANEPFHADGAQGWTTPANDTIPYTPAFTPAAQPFPAERFEEDVPLVSMRQRLFQAEQELARLRSTGGAGPSVVPTDPLPASSVFSKLLLKQLSDMKEFDGKTTWKEYQDSCENKAAQVLPRHQWLRVLHSKITGRALEHAKSLQLVHEGELQGGITYEFYCEKMNSALFGEVLTKEGAFARVVQVVQEGKFADPLDFLREKERLLSKIPHADLSPSLRASAALLGMDPELRNQVHSQAQGVLGKDLHFQSYEQLKEAVLALVLRQGEMLAGMKGKRPQNPAPNHNPSQSQKSPRYGQTSNTPGKPFYPKGAPPYRPTWGPHYVPIDQRTCVDCKQVGHTSKNFWQCPLYAGPMNPAGGRSGSGGRGAGSSGTAYQGGRGAGAGKGVAGGSGGAGGSKQPPPPPKT